ncbi:hypothetical protein PIROE2DRAFT_10811 [Piromyces sp. E2]|nr:hypothetical protein PIROE2DRAFT_10811 [Piromyces sp. E2]|eukprot:OUM62779.1 hypothetical protein PIROE2DRAFT_10811 [Piromyces sp. E2]
MKFTTSIIALIAAASTIASPVLVARDDMTTGYSETDIQNYIKENVSEECQKILEKYAICLGVVNVENYSEICSENCNQFFQDPIKALGSCQDNPITRMEPETLEVTKYNRMIRCATDENGNVCPYALPMIDETKPVTSTMILDTCDSQKCTDITYEYYEFNLAHVDTNPLYNTEEKRQETKDSLKITLEKLSNHNCKYKHVVNSKTLSSSNDTLKSSDNSSNASSNATTVKVGTSIMVSLGLLLISYL